MEPVIQNNTEATGEPSTFAWPTEHEIVENWLGIKVVTNSHYNFNQLFLACRIFQHNKNLFLFHHILRLLE